MTPDHIRIRRENARRRRRALGTARLAVFVGMLAAVTLALASIGNAKSDTEADRAARSWPTADTTPTTDVPVASSRTTAVAARTKRQAESRRAAVARKRVATSRSAAAVAAKAQPIRAQAAPKTGPAARARTQARVQAQARAAARLARPAPLARTVRATARANGVAGAQRLPLTGAETPPMVLAAALLVLLGMLLQIAGQPLPARTRR